MGIRPGASVRVVCTDPAIELNNAKLLGINKTTLVVSSANGERFELPKSATILSDPVNWERTTGVLPDPAQAKNSGRGGWLVLLVLAGGGIGAGIYLAVRRAPETSTAAAPKIKLSASGSPATAAPGASAPAARPSAASDAIEQLIESRCYGTAIEKLEEQIRSQPNDFKPRLQLLKIYHTIGNAKQTDRVRFQIETHKEFSAEQKEEAHKIVGGGKPMASTAKAEGAPHKSDTAAAPKIIVPPKPAGPNPALQAILEANAAKAKAPSESKPATPTQPAGTSEAADI